jgi:hypothetical protein
VADGGAAMTFEEAMRWMQVHRKMVEDQSQRYDGTARLLSYRFTELLMAPHSTKAQQRLIDAIVAYDTSHIKMEAE